MFAHRQASTVLPHWVEQASLPISCCLGPQVWPNWARPMPAKVVPSVMTQGFQQHAEIELDIECLRANYHEIARRVGPSIKIIPAIKADAYGFGALETAKIFERLGAFALF